MRNTLSPFLLALAALVATGAHAASPVESSVAAAISAKASGDYAAMESALRSVLAQRPLHPRWTYHLAVARAKQGAADQALLLLEQVAAQGAAYEPETDPDLASVVPLPRFATVAAAFARNRAPVQPPAKAVITLDDPELVPEGLACGADGSCFVSSVRRGSITRVRPDGRAVPFVTPRRDGLMAALGMEIDPGRGLLWVASAALPELDGLAPEETGRTGVFAFALGDGRLVHKHLLQFDGKPHAFGDLRLLADGRLLVSDQLGGALYTLEPKSGAFKRVTSTGALVSPQGIALMRNPDQIFVADWSLGLMKLDLERGSVARVPTLPEVVTYGIDGLYPYRGALIAVQNGIRPNRVVRFELENGRVTQGRVLAANDPRFSEPTLGAVIGDSFRFIANSQWDRFDAEHRLPQPAELAAPLVLELPLTR